MTKTGSFWGMLLLSLPLACSGTSSLKLAPGSDGGTSAVSPDGAALVTEDAKTPGPDLATLPDVKPASDTVVLGPETGRTDTTLLLIDADPSVKPDAKPDNKLDTSPTTQPDAETIVRVDAWLRLEDTGKDPGKTDTYPLPLAGDAGATVSGIEVLPIKNFASVDSACSEGTATWLSTLSTYLAEDRKCWTDSDCQYISISNSCGQVCPVPINVQRIGEFSNYAIGKTEEKCSTCPQLTDMPVCAPPPGDGSVVCKNNLCVWK